MNKRKLSIGLVSGIIGALALTACNEVKPNGDAIVTFTESSGKTHVVVTGDVYNKYRDTANGIGMFYNAILETLVRYEFETTSGRVYKKTKSEIQSEAENNVKNAKNEADENHKTNNTSYDEEWEKILNQYGCEDEADLLQYFIYQLEKSEVTDKYFNTNKVAGTDSVNLLGQYIGVDNKGKVTNEKVLGSFPYHIRHVLASVSGGATNYYNGTISQTEAKTLSDIMKAFLDVSYTFADTARKFSGDTGSGAKGGDVGIMTTTTSFVNEFKLGIYAYDTIFGSKSDKAKESAAIMEGLGLDEKIMLDGVETTAKAYWENRKANGGIVEVPAGVFKLLGDYYDLELNADGKQVNEGNSLYYPRNILWNQYLNHHDPFVITNKTIDTTTGKIADTPYITEGYMPFNDQGYLTDEAGNVIIGVRSEHGIHFMITQKSLLDYDIESGKEGLVSLDEYYTPFTTSEEGYPLNPDSGTEKETYVNYIKSEDKSVQTTRASEIKTALKSFDKTYDYRLYQQYVTKTFAGQLTFNKIEGQTESLGDKIDKYISRTQENNRRSSLNSLGSSWSTYIEKIEVQDDNRIQPTYKDEAAGTVENYNFRLIPTRCAVSFKSHSSSDAAWIKGGACYYAK